MAVKAIIDFAALVASIQEFAYSDRGNGHYIKCNGYKVDIDMNYKAVKCECKDFMYRQSKLGGKCKHMQAAEMFYADRQADLKNEISNPIVWVSRAGRMVQARWGQLSGPEARAYYRTRYSADYDINIYA